MVASLLATLHALPDDSPPEAYRAVLYTLRTSDDPAILPELFPYLSHSMWQVRQATRTVYKHLGDPARIYLLTVAIEGTPDQQRIAARTLVAIHHTAHLSLNQLIELLHEEDFVAHQAQLRLVQEGVAALPALVARLSDVTLRRKIHPILRQLNHEAVAAYLLTQWPQADAALRLQISQLLIDIHHTAPLSIEELMRVLVETRSHCDKAAQLLRQRGPAVIPYLEPLVNHTDPAYRTRACWVFGHMPSIPAALPHVLTLLQDADVHVVWSILSAIADAGYTDAALVAPLIAHLQHTDTLVHHGALFALEKQGVLALPHLIPLLDHPQWWVRWSTVYLLGKLGVAATTAVTRLIPLLDDADHHIRAITRTTLEAIASPTAEAALAEHAQRRLSNQA